MKEVRAMEIANETTDVVDQILNQIGEWEIEADTVNISVSRRDTNGRLVYIPGARFTIPKSEIEDMAWMDTIATRYGPGEYLVKFRWQTPDGRRERSLTARIAEPANPNPAPQTQAHEGNGLFEAVAKVKQLLDMLGVPLGGRNDKDLALIMENAELKAKLGMYELLKEQGILRIGEPEPRSPWVEVVENLADRFAPILSPLVGRFVQAPQPGPRFNALAFVRKQNPPITTMNTENFVKAMRLLHQYRAQITPEVARNWLAGNREQARGLARGLLAGMGINYDELVAWLKDLTPMQLSTLLNQYCPDLATEDFIRYLHSLREAIKGVI